MKRYAETFFHYWYVALIPILVLPLGALAILKLSGGSTTVSTTAWAGPKSAQLLGSVDQYFTSAQNVANDLQQLLAIRSFDYKVAQASPQFMALANQHSDSRAWIATELHNNVSVTPTGPNVVTLKYNAKTFEVGREVLRTIIALAPSEVGALNHTQVPSSALLMPDQPSASTSSAGKKQALVDLLIALGVGLLLGGGFVVFKTATDQNVRYADEVTAIVGLPLLGTVARQKDRANAQEAG